MTLDQAETDDSLDTHEGPESPTLTEPATRRLMRLSVPVIVKLCEKHMPVSAVLSLTAGSILEFSRLFDAELDLLVNNAPVGAGQAVKSGENFGLKITRIHNVKDRIKAMGPA